MATYVKGHNGKYNSGKSNTKPAVSASKQTQPTMKSSPVEVVKEITATSDVSNSENVSAISLFLANGLTAFFNLLIHLVVSSGHGLRYAVLVLIGRADSASLKEEIGYMVGLIGSLLLVQNVNVSFILCFWFRHQLEDSAGKDDHFGTFSQFLIRASFIGALIETLLSWNGTFGFRGISFWVAAAVVFAVALRTWFSNRQIAPSEDNVEEKTVQQPQADWNTHPTLAICTLLGIDEPSLRERVSKISTLEKQLGRSFNMTMLATDLFAQGGKLLNINNWTEMVAVFDKMEEELNREINAKSIPVQNPVPPTMIDKKENGDGSTDKVEQKEESLDQAITEWLRNWVTDLKNGRKNRNKATALINRVSTARGIDWKAALALAKEQEAKWNQEAFFIYNPDPTKYAGFSVDMEAWVKTIEAEAKGEAEAEPKPSL